MGVDIATCWRCQHLFILSVVLVVPKKDKNRADKRADL